MKSNIPPHHHLFCFLLCFNPHFVALSSLNRCKKKQHPGTSLLLSQSMFLTSRGEEKQINNPAKTKCCFCSHHQSCQCGAPVMLGYKYMNPVSSLCIFICLTAICLARSWTLHSVYHWTSETQWLPAPQLWSYAFSSGRSAQGGRWWHRLWGCKACPGIRWHSSSWIPSGWWSGWTSGTETWQVREIFTHPTTCSYKFIDFCMFTPIIHVCFPQ